MSCLIRINLARYDDYQDSGSILARISQRRQLFQEIVAFSPETWLEERKSHLEKVFGKRAKDTDNGCIRAALLDLIQSLQMSVMLYAIRTLFLDNGIYALIMDGAEEMQTATDLPQSCGIVDLQQVEAVSLQVLHASLRRIWATEKSSPDWFGKFTIWPLFMLGMSLNPVTEPDETKDFICRSLLRLGHHMGSMAYKDAIWAMQHTWERTGEFERANWLGELPLEVLPGLFFM